MNLNENQYHVLTLTSAEQAALRYCLYNLAQQKIIQYMDFVSRRPDFSLEKIGQNIMEIFKQYDTISTLLTPFQGGEAFKGKTKLLMYNPFFYKYIIESVNKYNFVTSEFVVGSEIAQKIQTQMEDLTEAVNYSSSFTFSSEEIRKASK